MVSDPYPLAVLPRLCETVAVALVLLSRNVNQRARILTERVRPEHVVQVSYPNLCSRVHHLLYLNVLLSHTHGRDYGSAATECNDKVTFGRITMDRSRTQEPRYVRISPAFENVQ